MKARVTTYEIENDNGIVHHIWRRADQPRGSKMAEVIVYPDGYQTEPYLRSDMTSSSDHTENVLYMKAQAEAFPEAIALYEQLVKE